MTAAASLAGEETGAEAAATVLPAAERRKVLAYAGVLLLLLNFAAPNGGLIGVPISFFLKNRLHLRAHELALFNLWTGAPLYAAFVFGLLRDRWSPLGTGDRGHLVLFGAATAAVMGVGWTVAMFKGYRRRCGMS